MTITYTIPGVPLINQLSEATSDGQPDENARMNCVFASNAALATAYLHKPFNGDQLKDMDNTYGQGYVGGASEANLVDTMAKLGITMTRVQHDTQKALVDDLHWQIEHYHHACIITMPSQWNSAVTNAGAAWNPRTYSGPSHVGLACGVGPGEIRVMNPWGGFWHDGSDSYWAARLLEGEIWVGEYVGVGGGVAVAGLPSGWKDDGKALSNPTNSFVVEEPFRTLILQIPGWDAADVPIEAAWGTAQVELHNTHLGVGSVQRTRYHQMTKRASSGSVFLTALGEEAKYLRDLAVSQYQQIVGYRAQVAALQQQLADALAKVGDPKAKALLDALRAALAA